MDHDLIVRLASAYITAGSLFFAYNHLSSQIKKERDGLPDSDNWKPLGESLLEIICWPAHVWPFKKNS